MKKNPFTVSRQIIELSSDYLREAEKLATRLNDGLSDNLLEIDCAPNGLLNAFYYRNGIESTKLLREIAEPLLGQDSTWLENVIRESSRRNPDYTLAETANFWKTLTLDNYDTIIDWKEPFCVKNQYGLTRVWHPTLRRLYRQGFATSEAIYRFVCTEQKTFLQPWHLPLESIGRQADRMIYRLIVYLPKQGEATCLGGLWISRPEFKIFIDEKAIVGAIKPIF